MMEDEEVKREETEKGKVDTWKEGVVVRRVNVVQVGIVASAM